MIRTLVKRLIHSEEAFLEKLKSMEVEDKTQWLHKDDESDEGEQK